MPELDRLIHEPSRLTLVAELFVVDEADFDYVSRRTGLTAGNISSHMSRLEDVKVNYIAVNRRRGQQLKDPAQLDRWVRDGSCAGIEALAEF